MSRLAAWSLALALATPAAILPAQAQQSTTMLAQAQQGATMDVSARGMDELIKALNALKGNREAGQAALALTILKGLGKHGAGPNGPELTYKVDLNPQGHLSINGLDVTAITEMVNKKK